MLDVDSTEHARRSNRARLVLIGGGVLCVAALLWLVFSEYARMRAAEKEAEVISALKTVGLGFANFVAQSGQYPPAFVSDEKGRALHSWRTLILPAIAQEAILREYRFTEPWDSPHNRAVIGLIPREYRNPFGLTEGGKTHWLMVTGDGTIGCRQTGVSERVVWDGDGTSRTGAVLVVESSDVVWTEPRDLTLDEAMDALRGRGPYRMKFFPSGYTHIMMCDGSVRRVRREELTAERLKAVFTFNGGEDVSWLGEQ